VPVDTHQFLQLAAGAIGLVAYLMLIIGLMRTNAEQSFAAFMLWAMLDLIATITSVLGEGNYWLPLSNAIGSSIITIILIVKKQVSWSRIETMTTVLVIICLIVWYAAGETAGIMASSLAVVIASVPQMMETYRKPATTPVGAYLVFLMANVLSLWAGKSWTIEERFYAGCSVFLCVVIIFLAMRKRISQS